MTHKYKKTMCATVGAVFLMLPHGMSADAKDGEVASKRRQSRPELLVDINGFAPHVYISLLEGLQGGSRHALYERFIRAINRHPSRDIRHEVLKVEISRLLIRRASKDPALQRLAFVENLQDKRLVPDVLKIMTNAEFSGECRVAAAEALIRLGEKSEKKRAIAFCREVLNKCTRLTLLDYRGEILGNAEARKEAASVANELDKHGFREEGARILERVSNVVKQEKDPAGIRICIQFGAFPSTEDAYLRMVQDLSQQTFKDERQEERKRLLEQIATLSVEHLSPLEGGLSAEEKMRPIFTEPVVNAARKSLQMPPIAKEELEKKHKDILNLRKDKENKKKP